jgi:3',5'-cyclic AMP phosphodiesterase CpdA
MVRRACWAVVFTTLGWAQGAEKLAGGPFAVNVGPRSATLVWVAQTSEAKLGLAPGKLDRTAPVLRPWKITYTSLEPGKTYYYEVLDSEESRGHFKTAPVGLASFHFVVLGDTRTRNDVHRRVIEAVVKTEPDFVIHTGDLVANGDDTKLWPIFFSIEKELLRSTAFFPCLGNHERNNRLYYEFFDMKTAYYSFDWGSAHFAVLNSDLGNVSPSRTAREAFWAEQTSWLEADLARAQKADLRFVVMHHPPFTAMKSRQGGNREVAQLVPLFEKYKVHGVFSGHDHNYQHHLKDGVHYIVTGGGGAPLYAVDAPIPGITLKALSTENFVTVKVEGSQATLEAIKVDDGSLIDQFQLPGP